MRLSVIKFTCGVFKEARFTTNNHGHINSIRDKIVHMYCGNVLCSRSKSVSHYVFVRQITMAARHPTSILVYNGPGCHEECRTFLHHALMSAVDRNQHSVQDITPQQVLEGSWMETSVLIVFGGGYDLGFESALGKEGANQIRRFVDSGGSYLGICAGAYWACDYIEFDKRGPLEVTGERFLKFYPGLCIGPAFPGFQYDSKAGVHAVPIRYKETVTFDAYMDGGGFFKHYKQSVIDQTVGAVDKSDTETNMVKSELHLNESPSDRDYQPASCDLDVLGPRRRSLVVDTLGKYSSLVETDSTAIVKCKVGDGMVILSGVHVEFPAQLLLQEDVYLKPWLPQFLRSEDTRLFVFKDILAQLGVQV